MRVGASKIGIGKIFWSSFSEHTGVWLGSSSSLESSMTTTGTGLRIVHIGCPMFSSSLGEETRVPRS